MRFLLISILSLSVSLAADQYPLKGDGEFAEWRDKRLELISLYLPPEPVIIQAGGHYGNETVNFAVQWPFSKIISFEPNPHAFDILSSITAYFDNIQIYNAALNDVAGVVPFYLCYGSSGKERQFEHASSLLKPSPAMEIHYRGPMIDVESLLLDEWCEENQIEPDFLSLNVQGAELQVLKNAEEVLKNIKCLEVHTHFFPFRLGTTHYDDLKNFLEESGFQLLQHWYREGLDGDAIFVKKNLYS